MILTIDPKWLREMAEKEGNSILSVGGLATRIEKEQKAMTKTELLKALHALLYVDGDSLSQDNLHRAQTLIREEMDAEESAGNMKLEKFRSNDFSHTIDGKHWDEWLPK